MSSWEPSTGHSVVGDMICVSTASAHFVYLNSIDRATELLEKQAALTANRPRNVLLDDIMGWSEGVGLHVHDGRHKKMRRVMASALHSTASSAYAPQHLSNTISFLNLVAQSPDRYREHATNAIGTFIVQMTYGIDEKDLIPLAHEAMYYLAVGLTTRFWVNDIPILKYIPPWFPGAEFKRFGLKGRKLRSRYVNEPFEQVVKRMRQNNIEHASYTSKLLQAKGGIDASPEDIDLVKWTAGAMYLAGSSTTIHVIMVFFLMMALYPEVARRAQEEIDTVVGRGRIPDFPDRELLPYVEALLQEVMRISPPSALGLPHTALEDIDFQGYRIPKNTTIHPNIWGMLHDPAYYSSPYEFLPDRYLKSAPDPDPRKYIFGFGRRVCPGLHVANDSAWIMCAGLLAIFDIRAGEDLNKRVQEIGGRESPQTYKLFDGYGASSPLPFKYKVTVRDEGAALLLEQISLLS
ncbi:O-methylsterigmatocystin oxidoreductase OS=Aspergillus flavus GN=ordA PE=3 SV=2 [Rhizoctonia solani AG-1 IB]|uniref:O-methylsterigmatocystin oxidoreductase n=1 Tax=Thanatephorus cucumeris (strain AG1-IB / isolate 7/3/14) TaxID=1108050 RepID=A0A0B7FRT0_THACB|nr:O-methylsterigmatocystin oxidoreductase OS=Aspergillus flavus GN=ordA PE=3 SV=2 [Rhizoctonia solani AG-1 IB]